MAIFLADDKQFQLFTDEIKAIAERLSPKAAKEDISKLNELANNFKIKTDDFFRENRKLNIGVVGQVKAGKSSFLNTLLFDGEEILPKASTPKTATLTKMEYSEDNIMQIEYYSPEEWEVLEDNAGVDLEDEIYTSAREIVGMVRRNGLDPAPYLKTGKERMEFDSYDDLIADLNNYVGEDGKFTPIVKAVTLYLNKEEFRGLSIVDTPGLNDPIASRTIRTKEFIEVCDVVFFLSQSSSFLDKSDWTLLSSQLPQKGVKKLVLIASKYDSGVRDVLREQDDDDIFGSDDNVADNIPDACAIIKRKLKKRAKVKVEEFVSDLSARESPNELKDVIRQCTVPVLVSAMACNMAKKNEEDYTKEERNVFAALKKFSADIQRDLRTLGNFDEVNGIFDSVVAEKEAIFEQKAKSFIPTAKAELSDNLNEFKEKANKRLNYLMQNDRESLLEQKNAVEGRINSIRSDIVSVFGELNSRLETEKSECVRGLRDTSRDYLDVRERSGSITRHGTYTTGHLFWKKTSFYTYQDHYSYCVASDAVENLSKFLMEAENQIEKVFTDTLALKEIKRKLLDVIVRNFDMGSEKYDSALFRILVEEAVGKIGFPILNIDISDSMNGITAKFTGELTSADQKTELTAALSNAVTRIYDELCNKLTSSVADYKEKLKDISKTVESSLLESINNEFETLLSQFENKENEIAGYASYIELLDKETDRLKGKVPCQTNLQ